MVIRKLNKLPLSIAEFIRIASYLSDQSGIGLYLVGGIVRDLIIGRESFDYDFVVEADAIEFARAIAGGLSASFKRHRSFGTAAVYYKNYKIDIASARKEYYSCPGALPKVSPAMIEKDLFRRDFTVNAMAISLNKSSYGRLVDPCGGYADLKKGILRVMHNNSFLDDPTRMLRIIRFEQRFSFKIERHTFNLLKRSATEGALSFIDEQRIRDELVLILKESCPLKYIKRIQAVIGFTFIDDKLKLSSGDYRLLKKIEQAVEFYQDNFMSRRRVDTWLIYLMGILNKLSQTRVKYFCRKFALRRGEEKILLSFFKHKKMIRYLGRKKIRKSTVFNILVPLSFEAIIFIYACNKSGPVKNNIIFFLNNPAMMELKINGYDLKELGLKPYRLYGKALDELKNAKIEKGFITKEEELLELKKIFRRLCNNNSVFGSRCLPAGRQVRYSREPRNDRIT